MARYEKKIRLKFRDKNFHLGYRIPWQNLKKKNLQQNLTRVQCVKNLKQKTCLSTIANCGKEIPSQILIFETNFVSNFVWHDSAWERHFVLNLRQNIRSNFTLDLR